MKTYTVHFPKGTTASTHDALLNTTLIADGFSWGAFFFGPFWFFWNRLWLAGFLVLGAITILSVLFSLLEVHEGVASIINLLIMILQGLEANTLKRWTFECKGRPIAGFVTGQDDSEAEAKMIVIGLKQSLVRESDDNSLISSDPTPSVTEEIPSEPTLFSSSEQPR